MIGRKAGRSKVEYQHGGDIYGDSRIRLDFSVNTNPLGMPEAVRQAVIRSAESWQLYPDAFCRRLRRKLADYYGNEVKTVTEPFSPEDFLCGNGASDLLYSLIYALRPKRALLAAPSFSEYEKALRSGGCEPLYFFLDEKKEFSLEAEEKHFFSRLCGPEPIDMVIVGNPNNPNGLAVPAEWIKRLADCCREQKIFLVIDECFNWFLEERSRYSAMELIGSEPERYRHVAVLNAFTKIFAMAGLRLGYLACRNREILEAIEGCRQPWSVSAPAEAAGMAALEETEFIIESAETTACGRRQMAAGLRGLGFHVYPSMVNYLLFRPDREIDGCGAAGFDYAAYCKQNGILIRSCRNFIGLNGDYYRTTVKGERENSELLSCLEEAARKAGQGMKAGCEGGNVTWQKRL